MRSRSIAACEVLLNRVSVCAGRLGPCNKLSISTTNPTLGFSMFMTFSLRLPHYYCCDEGSAENRFFDGMGSNDGNAKTPSERPCDFDQSGHDDVSRRASDSSRREN